MTPTIPVRLLSKDDRIELPDGRIADVIWLHMRGDFEIVSYDVAIPIESVQVCHLDMNGKYDWFDAAPDFEVGFIRSAAEAVTAS